MYFIVSMQEEVEGGRGPKPKARETGSQRAAGDTQITKDGTLKDGGRDLMKPPLQMLSFVVRPSTGMKALGSVRRRWCELKERVK